jgi:hypothetical protein
MWSLASKRLSRTSDADNLQSSFSTKSVMSVLRGNDRFWRKADVHTQNSIS